MTATSKSAEWIFLATNLGLEILSAACDQASSPTKPHYALFGTLLAIAAVFISIGELIYRGKRERVVLRKWGMLWWFYHPSPRHTPFGTLPDIYGLAAGISQCICSIVQYVYCLRHADSPFKASLLPAIFLICLVGSRLTNKRMNANTTDNMDSWENSSSTEETSLHPIPEYYAPTNIPFLDNQEEEVEGNIEQQRQRWLGEPQEREGERLLQPELDLLEQQQLRQRWEREREQKREREQLQQRWEREQEREWERVLREQLRQPLQLQLHQQREQLKPELDSLEQQLRQRQEREQEQERERERRLRERERRLRERERRLRERERERERRLRERERRLRERELERRLREQRAVVAARAAGD